ncbi:MAG TPA: acyl-CoA dehydrogenase family protein [Dehalococcoidia bacterium]|nr:acyl-CoA dehydrogenase family protein [Dehalococcoidia bacterium]
MDVLLNEEEQMLKNLAREFLEKECPPDLARAMEADELGYPPALWRKLADLGWLGLALPEAHGGQGLPLAYLGLISEELGRAIAPVPFHSTMTAALTIAREGTEAQRREVLPAVARGDMVLTWAFTERDPRFLPETIQTQAEDRGDHFLLSGAKMFVDNFQAAQKCLIACRTAPGSSGAEGISLLLVDTQSPGISQTPLSTLAKDKQSQVVFQRVRVPKSSLVGRLNQGWPVAEGMLDRATALLCAQMVGATRKDAEMAIEYAKNRVAFGRPIGAFQSIQHLCADMIIWVDGGQLLTYEALWRMDQGLPASIEVSQAKAFCNDKCEAVVRSSQVIHGGIGFMVEFNLHLWFRRVSAWTMRLGTSFEHRARIARGLLDQPGRVRLGESMYQLAPSG